MKPKIFQVLVYQFWKSFVAKLFLIISYSILLFIKLFLNFRLLFLVSFISQFNLINLINLIILSICLNIPHWIKLHIVHIILKKIINMLWILYILSILSILIISWLILNLRLRLRNSMLSLLMFRYLLDNLCLFILL